MGQIRGKLRDRLLAAAHVIEFGGGRAATGSVQLLAAVPRYPSGAERAIWQCAAGYRTS